MNRKNQNSNDELKNANQRNKGMVTTNHFWFWLSIPLTIGLVISLFSPTDVLKYMIPREIVNFVGIIIPMVRKIRGEYELSQVAQFYYAVMWIITPSFSWLALRTLNPKITNSDANIRLFLIALLYSLMLRYVWLEGLDPNDIDSKYAVLLHSRLGMGFYGILIPIFAFIGIIVNLAFILGSVSYLKTLLSNKEE